MQIKAILFDLDGTLLPMDMDAFLRAYFGGLSAKLAPHGYEPKALFAAIWAGTEAMIKNDGTKRNEDVFWENFAARYEHDVRADIPLFDEFYQKNFECAKVACGFNPLAAKTVQTLKEKGYTVALATNPLFPAIATEHRMRWAGFSPEDFAVYTTYENSVHCKPNPEYYKDVARSIGVAPEECLMVGNDVGDDMVAKHAGMQVFLLTDCLLNKGNEDISAYPNGSFAELLAYVDSLQ